MSIDADKAFDKIQYPFVLKIFAQLEIDKNSLNMRQGIHEKPTADIISYV